MSKMTEEDKKIFDQGERLLNIVAIFTAGFIFALYVIAYSGGCN